MEIRFHKLTDAHHRLEIERSDGTKDEVECETRSYLLHDLTHFAVESAAELDHGFWALLARGVSLAALAHDAKEATAWPRLMAIEKIVASLQGPLSHQEPRALHAHFTDLADAQNTALPEWFTEDMLSRAQDIRRRLVGHWRATAYGKTMQISWPCTEPPNQRPR
ncbi:MAG: hypothetical protein AAGF12_00260 [Myxococcota bacterium]